MKPLRSPLFVVGFPRSGTTLLKGILGAHTQVELKNEPELLSLFGALGLRHDHLFDRPTRERVLRESCTIQGSGRHIGDLTEEQRSKFLNSPKDLSYAEAYERLLPRDTPHKVWGEKSLGAVFSLEDIRHAFPDSLVIHIVRDPRAAILSNHKVRFPTDARGLPFLRGKSIRYFAHRSMIWRHWMSAAAEGLEKLGPEFFHEIRYEDLLASPELHIKKLCEMIGVAYEPDMLDPRHRLEDAAYHVGHRLLAEKVDVSRARAGKDVPNWANNVVVRYAKDMLHRHGYDAADRPLDGFTRARLGFSLWAAGPRLRRRTKREILLRTGQAA